MTPLSTHGLDLGTGVGAVVTGPGDPLLIEVSHGVVPELRRVVLFVRVTNMTRVSLTGLS